MGIRAKMRPRCQPFLDEGERIEAVALAQSRWTSLLLPALVLLSWIPRIVLESAGPIFVVGAMVVIFGSGLLVAQFAVRYRILCWTDRSLVVFTSNAWRFSPTALLDRMPRVTRIGPLHGLWAKVQVGGETLSIPLRFHGDVAAAEASASPGARTRP